MSDTLIQNTDTPNLRTMLNSKHKLINPLDICNIENEYHLPEQLSTTIDSTNGSLKVIHLNIHSLPDKFDRLKTLLAIMNITPDIILLCETFLHENNYNNYNLPGYSLVEKHRKNKVKGGIAIYINTDITFKVRDDLSIFDEGKYESLFIETDHPQKYIIGEIYRIPNTSEHDSLNKFEETLNNLHNLHYDVVIGTDQNIDYLKIDKNKNCQELLNLFLTNGFVPTIIKPTRITHQTATLIDNLYVRTQNINLGIKSGILSTDISDHLPIYLELDSKRDQIKLEPELILTRKLNEANIYKIKEDLAKIKWNELLNSMETNKAHVKFISELTKTIDKHAPEQPLKINKRTIKEKWMTPALIKLANKKNRLYKKAINKSLNDPLRKKYVDKRNEFNKLKRSAKAIYYKDLLEKNTGNLKRTWQIMRESMNKTNDKSTIVKTIKVNNKSITNNNEITHEFCDYFTNIGQNLASNIPKPKKSFQSHLRNKVNRSIYLNPTDDEEVAKIISNMKSKNSSGHDKINSNLLKKLKNELKHPISLLINKSINSGIFPDIYKIAEVIPIHKAKDREILNNYRPISLLPTFSKILEKILHIRLYKYLQKNNILNPSQYGFRPKHSTTDAIAELVNKVTKNFENKSYTIGTFLDLSKAFDTINHDILIHKLEHYGIRGLALKWFQNYLSNRKQYTKVNGTKSAVRTVKCGVPQGSVLGPLLFIIYTNDLPNNLKNTSAILFADDTTLITQSEQINEVYANANIDLNIICDWFKSNKLSLNIGKTHYIFFPFKSTHVNNINNSIAIGDVMIERKQYVKFLGVIIDENLNWKQHIISTRNKIVKITYCMKTIKNLLPLKYKKTLYESLIKPHLEYGIIFWGGIPDSHLNCLVKQQKKIIRLITNSNYNAHTAPIFNKLKCLKLIDLYKLNSAKFMYKAKNRMLPQTLCHMYIPNTIVHGHNTRQQDNPHLIPTRNNQIAKQISQKGPEIWIHYVPPIIKESRTINQLSRNLKKHFLMQH